MRENHLKFITNMAAAVLSFPFNVVSYLTKHPHQALTIYLLSTANFLVEAIKIQKVNYVTYSLGNLPIPAAGIHSLHVGLHFELADNTYRELHFGNGLHETVNQEYENRRRLATYEIGNINMEYEVAKKLIENEFSGKKYVFGKRDCWKLVEWFSEDQMGKDKNSLDGPIGKRKGIGNGVRCTARQAEKTWLNIRHSGEDAARKTITFFKNPIQNINDGIEKPQKVVKNIENAFRKFLGR